MKLNSVLTLLFIALFTACKGGAYDLSGYGLKPDTGENASPLIAKALQEIAAEVNSDTVRILLPKGRYDFYPEGASKREYFISNHDQDNPKLVGLAFENMKNVIFDGQGSELVFHGRMLPVSLVGSENCTLKNFSIDFANPHISQVKVLENDTVGGLIDRFLGSYYVDVTLPFDIKYRSNVGIDIGPWYGNEFYGALSGDRSGSPARAVNARDNRRMYTWENLLMYNKTFKKDHTLGVTFLQSIQQETYEKSEIKVKDLPYENQEWNNVGSAQTIESVSSDYRRWRLASFMGRVN